MFFRRKNQEALCQRLDDLSSRLDALTQSTNLQLKDSVSQMAGQLETDINCSLRQLEGSMQQHLQQMDNRINQIQADVHKHDMALEDLLDEWAEKKSDEDNINTLLQESIQAEKLLLELFEAYQEQFWNLKHYAASKDSSWAAQVLCMEKNLEHCQRSCAISLIQECGVSVDYDLHEIIEAVDTTDPTLDKTIAEIYRCGYLYKGKVRKKAQAAAYRLTGSPQ